MPELLPTSLALARRSPGLRVPAILALVLALSLCYWPTTLSLLKLWETPGNNYHAIGYVVACSAAWFAVRRRQRIESAALRPSLPAAIALLPLGIAWLVAYRANFEVAHQIVLPAILWVAVCAAWGREIGWASLFPLAFLYFGIPMWDLLAVPLQFVTVHVAGALVEISGVPVHIEGDLVQIPAGTFEIEGGCAGVRFLIVGLILAAFYGELMRDCARKRLLLLVLGASFAVISNWIRVAGVILIGQASNMGSPVVRDHRAFGWYIFAASSLLFSLAARRVSSPRPFAELPACWRPRPHGGRLASGLAATLVCSAIAPLWAAATGGSRLKRISAPLLVQREHGCVGPDASHADWQPIFRGATLEQIGTYRCTDGSLQVYVAAYASQSQQRKLLGYFNSVLGNDGGEIHRRTRIVAAGRTVNELEVQRHSAATGNLQAGGFEPGKRQGRSLLWYTYEIDRRTFASGLSAQLWYAVTSLAAAPESRVIALRAACEPDCAHARSLLDRFMSENAWLFSRSHDEPTTAGAPMQASG